jgi:putative membrane protein
MWTPRWMREGQEPDYRFSLANERTFLAWIRTALALLAGGLVLDQFATRLRPHSLVVAIAVGLTVLSMLLCGMAYLRWRDNEIAMRHARALRGIVSLPLMAAATATLSAAIAASLLMQ